MGSVCSAKLRGNAWVARFVCALLAAGALAPCPATAQQQTYAIVQGEVLDSTTLVNNGDLNFGLIMPNATGGTVVLTPAQSATCTTTGGLIRSGTCKAAQFIGQAVTGADLRVMRPSGNSITLTGPAGATMQVNTFTFGSTAPTVFLGNNGANWRFRVDASDGTYLFFVGGTLNVGPSQRPGVYNGSFTIRITYN
ncbi:MAG TPA: DUF4402 domain-containing protein [Croceibacterium sp.]|nr:DUF4402 domain-containing protein [Croceibacterium sp.]